MPEYITDNIEISSDDSSEENPNEEYSDEENFDEEILIDKIKYRMCLVLYF